ncbi:hypothetical protein CPB83DRAFT_796698 [Crepidotus variabilis]|uniref:DUF6589 domain-containing protein n=1 Tax=Crepidotus variabilis TaxID=179855 RepID=A0A9P6EA25_9AGAR|nr:hypothetical protein CPB83DRAFT_796698 [Crepidotus variabilis]
MAEILDDSNPEYSFHRNSFYREDSTKLFTILDLINIHPAGGPKLKEWLRRDAAFEAVTGLICEEMDIVRELDKLPGLSAVTPDFISSMSLIGSTYRENAPCLHRVLMAASQTKLAKEKNKRKTPEMLCDVMIKQLSYQRSSKSLGFATIFGLFLWATGCARQTIDALHHCGLSIAYTSVLEAIRLIADHCNVLAVEVGADIHIFCYDNINLSTSIFVEQRGSLTPAKVTSGTFPVLYKVCNGKAEDMKLAPILERLKGVKGLNFNRDIRPTIEQTSSFQFQLEVVVVRVLTTYCREFEGYQSLPKLQHKARRPLPKSHITEHFPMRVTTIEEASVDGNLLFHDDVYINQLNRSPEQLSTFAIPSFNDQLTNSRIRSAQILRAQDINAWERREVFQLGFGLFHLCLNLIWALLHIHRGTLEQVGSLTYWFALLNKVRLGGEHPDYYTLLAALTQIHDGIMLQGWRQECGYPSLSAFAKSKPSADILLDIAFTIINKHATPLLEGDIESEDESDGSGESADEALIRDAGLAHPKPKKRTLPPEKIEGPNPDRDRVHQNTRTLLRDLLHLMELIRAISDGDIGRIEDFLPNLAMMFRGAGGNNYCTEILHFILNLKHVWTPGFANIMRDNMLVNLTGLDGHAMPIDENIEHLIGKLKQLLSLKGLESTWDRLGNISAAIDYLNKVKKKVSASLSSSYQSSTHTSADVSELVWKIAEKARSEEMLTFKDRREKNGRVKAVVNILAHGEAKLKSSSLGTFNKKVLAMVEGRLFEEEVDTLPQLGLNIALLEGGSNSNID